MEIEFLDAQEKLIKVRLDQYLGSIITFQTENNSTKMIQNEYDLEQVTSANILTKVS